MEKNLTKNFDNQNISQENNFDSIKITLASPEKLSHGPMVKLKNQRQLITEHFDLKKMDCFAQEFWSSKRLRVLMR